MIYLNIFFRLYLKDAFQYGLNFYNELAKQNLP